MEQATYVQIGIILLLLLYFFISHIIAEKKKNKTFLKNNYFFFLFTIAGLFIYFLLWQVFHSMVETESVGPVKLLFFGLVIASPQCPGWVGLTIVSFHIALAVAYLTFGVYYLKEKYGIDKVDEGVFLALTLLSGMIGAIFITVSTVDPDGKALLSYAFLGLIVVIFAFVNFLIVVFRIGNDERESANIVLAGGTILFTIITMGLSIVSPVMGFVALFLTTVILVLTRIISGLVASSKYPNSPKITIDD